MLWRVCRCGPGGETPGLLRDMFQFAGFPEVHTGMAIWNISKSTAGFTGGLSAIAL